MNTTDKVPKTIIFDLGHVIFHYDPDLAEDFWNTNPEYIFKPLSSGVSILKQCYAQIRDDGSQLHTLCVLSNASVRSLLLMQRLWPDIFTHFKHIMISGHVGMQKPDIRIYNYFLTTYNLQAEHCIFIDDKVENIAAAQTVGIKGILFDNPTRVTAELINLGIF